MDVCAIIKKIMNMRQYIARMICGVMMIAAAIGSSFGQVPEIHVDTIDSVAVICPGETLVWHGIEAAQTGTYTHNEVQPSGKENFYRLQLTVRELVVVDSTFTICEDEYVQFNGKIYTDPGCRRIYMDVLGKRDQEDADLHRTGYV